MKQEPSDLDILVLLEMVKSKGEGVFSLENKLAKGDVEPSELTLYFEKGNYLLMLLDYDEEGYIDVRTPYNPAAPHDVMQYILGEQYGATTIVQDFEIVKKCFIEFNQRGDVTRDILY